MFGRRDKPIAPDSNIFYYISRDCRNVVDKEKCEERKAVSKKVIEIGEQRGCVILPTVDREVRRVIIKEYAPYCEVVSVKGKDLEKIRKFVDKLVVKAINDELFLELCTSKKGEDKFDRIKSAMKGDWKLLGEAISVGAEVVTFDHNLTDSYCRHVYEEVAKDVFGKGVDVESARAFVSEVLTRESNR